MKTTFIAATLAVLLPNLAIAQKQSPPGLDHHANGVDIPDPSTFRANIGAVSKSGDTVTGAFNFGTSESPVPVTAYAVDSGGLALATGDKLVSFDTLHNHVNIMRQILTGATTAPQLYSNLDQKSSGFHALGFGSGPDIPNVQFGASTHPGATGQVNTLLLTLATGSNQPYITEDQALNIQGTKTGQSSVWGINESLNDITGLAPQAFAAVDHEMNIRANGPDLPATAYDPTSGSRIMSYYHSIVFPNPTYASLRPGQTVVAGTRVVASPSSGGDAIFIAANTGAICNPKVTPAWTTAPPSPYLWPTGTQTLPPWSPSDHVSDCGVNWVYGTTKAMSVGRVIWIDGDNEVNSGLVSYGVGFSTNARFDNAVIDLSKGTLTDAANGAYLRLPSGGAIDFTANGTPSGRNKHTLRYSTFDGPGLKWNVGNTTMWNVLDTGQMQSAGSSLLAFGGQASLAGVTTGYSTTGLTIGRNFTSNEIDLVLPAAGLSMFASSGGDITDSFLDATDSTIALKRPVTATETLSVKGVVSVGNSTAMSSGTKGYNAAGLTFGYNHDLDGRSNIMVGADGLNIRCVQSDGTLCANPALTLTGTGDLGTTGTVNASAGVQIGGVALKTVLSATTSSIGGSALATGQCASGTVRVGGATTAMVAVISPVTYPGDGASWRGYVSTNGTVMVKVCAEAPLTPIATAYNVRVLQ
jgi:hypothetical protein